jgi:hypothetical protein
MANMAAIAAQGGMPGGQCYTRIWIGGLPRNSNVDEVKSELKRVFTEFGYVLDVCVITTARDVMSFVQFENEQDAYKARETMNGSTILGSLVKVNYAVIRGQDEAKKPGRPTSRSRSRDRHRSRLHHLNGSIVLVENLSSDTTPESLAEIGAQASPGFVFSNIWREGRKTMGLLNFEDYRQAAVARKYLDGFKISDPSSRSGRGHTLTAMSIAEYNENRNSRGSSPKR